MKDFARPHSNRSSKKSFKQCFKSLISVITKYLRWLVLGLVALGFIFLLIVIFGPRFIRNDTNQNIVFLTQNDEGKISQIYFAYFQGNAELIEVYQLNPELPVNWLSERSLEINQINLDEWLQQLNQKKQQNFSPKDLTWLSGRVVEEVIWVPVDVDIQTSSDLAKAFNFKLFNASSWLDFALNQRKLRVFLLTRQAEWEPFRQANSSDFTQTEVLSNDCVVGVINTTNISGYASSISSILEQSGARVVRVGNDQQRLKNHRLAFNNHEESCHLLAAKLEGKILQGQVDLINDATLNKQLLNRYRADMIILLGRPE